MALPKDYNENEEHFQDVTVDNKRGLWDDDDILDFTSQDEDTNQWPTQVKLNANYRSSYNPIMPNGLPIDQQVTWILPVVHDPRKTAKRQFWNSGTEGYVSQIIKLVKDSGIYALATLATPLVSLLLAPFLTHTLSSNDFGALAVLITMITLVSGVTQLGISAAFFRAYSYDYESERDKLDVLSTTTLLLSFISVPTAIAMTVTAPWLATLLLNNSSFSTAIKLTALVVLMQNLAIPGLSWLRAESRVPLFSLLTILNLLIIASATIVLVGVLHLGIAGSLIAMGGGNAIVVLFTLPLVLSRAGFHLRYDISRGLFTFGFPHVINLLSGWILQVSDRYLIAHLASLSQAAGYAVAYSLGGALSPLIIAPFSLAWWNLMFTIAKREDAVHTFQFIFRWFSIVLLFATFGLSIFGVVVLDLFFPPAYHSAASIIPIIATSIMFNGIFVVVSLGISIQGKTWYSAILITSSGVLNFGLNLVLIPLYGAWGAAVATLIAYFVLAVATYFVNQRIYSIPFEIGLFSIALLIGVALYMGSDFLAQLQTLYIAWGIRISGLILYGGSLMVLGRLPARK